MQKEREKKAKKECVSFLLFVLKLYVLELQIPWIRTSSAVHKTYLYLYNIFPQEACLPHTV